MSFIYKITNLFNSKAYIGMTSETIEKRWKQHCNDSIRSHCKERPLYRAFAKYGIENFSIEILEETDNPIEREIFWIETLGTFKYGYNATIGGEGRSFVDYDVIFNLYQAGENIESIHKITGHDWKTIDKVLKRQEITQQERKKRGIEAHQKMVAKLDKKTKEILKVYVSIKEAYADLEVQYNGHISGVCNGRRQSAYGFKWKYI